MPPLLETQKYFCTVTSVLSRLAQTVCFPKMNLKYRCHLVLEHIKYCWNVGRLPPPHENLTPLRTFGSQPPPFWQILNTPHWSVYSKNFHCAILSSDRQRTVHFSRLNHSAQTCSPNSLIWPYTGGVLISKHLGYCWCINSLLPKEDLRSPTLFRIIVCAFRILLYAFMYSCIDDKYTFCWE